MRLCLLLRLLSEQSHQGLTKFPHFILAYHGCSKEIANRIIDQSRESLEESDNAYDWLGRGVYFWENDPVRALQWAKERYADNAAAIGAVIDLGLCLNMTDQSSIRLVSYMFQTLQKTQYQKMKTYQNKGKRRNLDCFVINTLYQFLLTRKTPFDTSRAIFYEDSPIYETSGFLKK